MAHMLKAAAGVVALAALSACTTAMRDEPAPQMQIAAALPEPLPSSPSTLPPSAPPMAPPTVDDLTQLATDRVYFAYDKADLDEAALDALRKQAEWLNRLPSVVLVIEGHSDERGTREYNLALSARRATAVRIYLMTQGVSGARLETLSYGKERPSCTGSEEICWKLNRRAVSIVNLEATNRRN